MDFANRNRGQLLDSYLKLRANLSKLQTSKWFVRVTVVIVAGLAVFAWRNLPSDRSPSYPLLAVAFLIGVTSLLVAGLEFQASSKLCKVSMGWAESTRYVLIGSIANIMPLPGSQIVRVGALKGRGLSVRAASICTFSAGLLRVAVAVVVSLLAILAEFGTREYFLIAIVFVIALVSLGIYRWQRSRLTTVTKLLVIDISLVALQTLRFVVLGRAFGLPVGLSDAAAVTLAATLATGLGILPSGIGVREGLAVAFSPFLSIGWTEVLVISISDQATSYMLFLFALIFIRRVFPPDDATLIKRSTEPGSPG